MKPGLTVRSDAREFQVFTEAGACLRKQRSRSYSKGARAGCLCRFGVEYTCRAPSRNSLCRLECDMGRVLRLSNIGQGSPFFLAGLFPEERVIVSRGSWCGNALIKRRTMLLGVFLYGLL
jgi:hypothetical protein